MTPPTPRRRLLRFTSPLLTVCVAMASGACAFEGATEDDVYGTTAEELKSVAAPGPRRPLTFARDTSERIDGVPVYRDSRPRMDGARPIYTVRADDVSAGERFRLRAQVMVSRCGRKDIWGLSDEGDGSPCATRAMRDHPYDFAPRVHAAFTVSDRREGAGRRISDWFSMVCTDGKHHCTLATPEIVVGDIPPGERRFLKLVVASSGPDARVRDGHVIEVEQGRGGLYVTRELPGHTTTRTRRQDAPRIGRWLGIDQTEDEGDHTLVRRQIFRVKLRHLEPGDVIEVDGRMRAEIRMRDPGCDPLINTQVILTRRRDASQPHGSPDGVIAGRAGANCTAHGGSCVYETTGAIGVGGDVEPTMFVSLVAYAKRSCAAPGGRDTWRAMRRGSHFRVRARSADPDGRRARLSAVEEEDPSEAVPFARYWNPHNTDHYYTIDRDDAGAALFGYTYEGNEGALYPDQEGDTLPFFQFWCGDRGDHFYTLDAIESELIAASGCDYEGIAGYARLTAGPGTVPLHRYRNPTIRDHFYTLDRNDAALALYGYAYEGVAAHVRPL